MYGRHDPAAPPYTVPLPGRAPLELGRAHARDGHPQRHARFVRRRRRPLRCRAGRRRAGCEMVAEGADIIDVGGESTRPGADGRARSRGAAPVLPVIERLAAARRARLDRHLQGRRGARGRRARRDDRQRRQRASYDAGLAAASRRAGAALVLMHNRGQVARDVPRGGLRRRDGGDVRGSWQRRCERAVDGRRRREAIVLDPGLGFAKRAEHTFDGPGGARSLGGARSADPVGARRASRS